MIASEKGHVKIADLLIAAGADIHAKSAESSDDGNRSSLPGGTSLLYAAGSKHTAVVKALIEAGVDVNAHSTNNWTALALASARGNVEIVRTLIDTMWVDLEVKTNG